MKRRKLIFSSALYIGIFALCFLMLDVKCTLEKPSAPSWDVQFIIPLIDKKYTMEKFADEEKYLSIDEQTGTLNLNIDKDLDINIGSLLKVNIPGNSGWFPYGTVGEAQFDIPTSGVLIGDSARIDTGIIAFTFQNPTNSQAHIVFKMPDMFAPNGDTLTVDRDIPAQGTINIDLDISNYLFKAYTQGNTNYLRIRVNPTGPAGQQMWISWDFKDVAFASITGTFNNVTSNLDSIEVETGFPDYMKDFQVQSADLDLIMRVGLKVPTQGNIEIIFKDDEGQQISNKINIPINLPAWSGTGNRPELTYHQDITDYINGHPARIIVNGSIQAGNNTYATVSIDDPVDATVKFEAPLIMRLPSYDTKFDVDTLEIDKDTRDLIHDNLMGVKLEGVIENHLPVGAKAFILFSKDRGDSTIYDPGYTPDILESIILDSAITDGGNPAVVVTPVTSQINVELTKEELALFENPEVFFGVRLEFSGTTGLVKIRPSDYIVIKARLSASVETKFTKDDE